MPHVLAIDLHTTKWSPTRKSSKPYLPLTSTPPHFPLKKMRALSEKVKLCSSSEHKVKGFADDLSVFSSSRKGLSWRSILSVLPSIWKSDLTNVSLSSFQKGKSSTTSLCFTSNIQFNPTKFLGQTIGASVSKLSSKTLATKLTSCLEQIDKSLIRGDFKV